MKTINNLAINGGGSCGVMAIKQLVRLHEIMGDAFLRYFDYISGTSTGALICALLAMGFTPKQILEIYVEHLPKIFKKGCVRTLRGLSKYDNNYLIKLAYKLVGDITLGELKQKILIPAYNADLDTCRIFKSYDPDDADIKLVDVIIASAAAPTYFPAHKVRNHWYKDGGLARNNPSLVLMMESMTCKADKINILNITTGSKQGMTTEGEQRGNLFSVIPMIDEVLYTQDMVTDDTVYFCYNRAKIVKGTYVRCESIRKNCSGDIDDVSAKNIKAMLIDGDLSIAENEELLNLYHINTLKSE